MDVNVNTGRWDEVSQEHLSRAELLLYTWQIVEGKRLFNTTWAFVVAGLRVGVQLLEIRHIRRVNTAWFAKKPSSLQLGLQKKKSIWSYNVYFWLSDCALCIECVSHGFRESSLLWPGATERAGRGSAESPRGHFHPRLRAGGALQTGPVPPVYGLLLVCSGGHRTAHSWNLHQVISSIEKALNAYIYEVTTAFICPLEYIISFFPYWMFISCHKWSPALLELILKEDINI